MWLSKLNDAVIKFQFTASMRFSLYSKLVEYMNSGVPLPQALDTIYKHVSHDGKKPKAVQAVAVRSWRREVLNGRSFGQAITGWVPDKERVVIEAGEAAGNLGVAIENAIFIHQGNSQLLGAIASAVIYPAVLLGMTLGYVYIFGTQVVPEFAEITPTDQWVGIPAQLAVMSDFVQNWMAHCIVALLAIIVLFFYSLPRWTGRIRTFLDRFPPWSLYRLSMGCGFLLGVSTMHRAGIPMPQALKILSRNAKPWYRQRIEHTRDRILNGYNLGEALYRTGYEFPDRETVIDLRAFADLTGFDKALDNIGHRWMNTSVQKTRAQAAIIRNLAIVIMGLTVLWLVMGVMSLQSMVQSTM